MLLFCQFQIQKAGSDSKVFHFKFMAESSRYLMWLEAYTRCNGNAECVFVGKGHKRTAWPWGYSGQVILNTLRIIQRPQSSVPRTVCFPFEVQLQSNIKIVVLMGRIWNFA